jgi:asparagine synthase (glutamine-hydrolysing)
MCGIVGFISHQHFDSCKSSLPHAALSLSHRGPDDSGIFFDKTCGLGLAHRRLSVIDLSQAGRQPMQSEDGQVCIDYNGEVYNFREIRNSLEKLGHRFQSATDTEVILKAYLQWGVDCVRKFMGMFALALWDRRTRHLILMRDRLGVKPLYYYFDGETFLFASELKAFMAFERFKREIDADAVPLFLHYQYIPAPRTVFRNTCKLLPGHFLIFDGRDITIRSYWNLPDASETADSLISEDEELQRLDALLTKAVSDRLISDVPLGALLSGGIDSSVVTAIMQKISAKPVKTFTIGFREAGYNEAPHAAQVAEYLGTDHTELYVSPGEALSLIPRLPEIYDEPFADASAIPTFLVSQLARSRVTVALSGDGGDEQFCGYVRYWTTQAMGKLFGCGVRGSGFGGGVKKILAPMLEKIPPDQLEKCYRRVKDTLPQYLQVANFSDKWQKLLKLMRHSQDIQELYRMTICLWDKEELAQVAGSRSQVAGSRLQGAGSPLTSHPLPLTTYPLPLTPYETIFAETEGLSLLSRFMRADQKTYLPDALLTKADRASMAVGLELRAPLLDHRLMEYTSRLPDHLKYRNGAGKYLLKKLLARYMPDALFERPKMGFGIPIAEWFRGELKPMLSDYLSSERLKAEGLFDARVVEEKISEHLSGKVNHHYRLWALLMWEMWRERWLNG